MIVALLVVGPSKLPDLAKSLGKALGEFRRMADEVKETIEEEMVKEKPKDEAKKEAEAPKETEAAAPPVTPKESRRLLFVSGSMISKVNMPLISLSDALLTTTFRSALSPSRKNRGR